MYKHPSMSPCPSGTCPATGKLHVLGRPLLATGVWRRERLCGTLSLDKTETQKPGASVLSAALAIHKHNGDIRGKFMSLGEKKQGSVHHSVYNAAKMSCPTSTHTQKYCEQKIQENS